MKGSGRWVEKTKKRNTYLFDLFSVCWAAQLQVSKSLAHHIVSCPAIHLGMIIWSRGICIANQDCLVFRLSNVITSVSLATRMCKNVVCLNGKSYVLFWVIGEGGEMQDPEGNTRKGLMQELCNFIHWFHRMRG
jgi:hypothetical protein